MTTTVTITGTGHPLPSATRAGPGTLVQSGDQTLLFDAGRGTVGRLAALGLGPGHLTGFFATHHHSDHLVGLPDVVLTRWTMARGRPIPPLPVVMPRGPAVAFAERMLDAWDADIAVRKEHTDRIDDPSFDIVAFELPDEPAHVWSAGDVRVIAGRVRHDPVHPAVGYRVETPDGSIAISGDTIVCDEVADLAAGADVLVYEAMRAEIIEQLGSSFEFLLGYHADTRLIGRQAAELGVGTLVLTHLIPEPADAAELQAYVDDIRNGGFEGELIVANDLDAVTLG